MRKSRIFIVCILITGFCIGQSDLEGNDETIKTIQDIGDVLQLALPIGAGLSTVILWDKEGA